MEGHILPLQTAVAAVGQAQFTGGYVPLPIKLAKGIVGKTNELIILLGDNRSVWINIAVAKKSLEFS